MVAGCQVLESQQISRIEGLSIRRLFWLLVAKFKGAIFMNEFDIFLLNILNVIDNNNIQNENERGYDNHEVEIMGGNDQCGIHQD